MKYALINDQRVEATSKGKATCPICGTVVIAKCGTRRIHHWAHKGLENCDPWKESETLWHRAWKDKYPTDWQEYTQHDPQTGEKHIADVRTVHGLVIEFQHSHIDPKERIAREQFHKNMFWMVDGTRLKRDLPRFDKGKSNFRHTPLKGFFIANLPEEIFPEEWLESSAPVVFDFVGLSSLSSPDFIREHLWCLYPGRADGNIIVAVMSRSEFVAAASISPYIFRDPAHAFVNAFSESSRVGTNFTIPLPDFRRQQMRRRSFRL